MSCSSAASRSVRSGPSFSRAIACSRTISEWSYTSLWRWCSSRSRRSAGSSGSTRSASPVSTSRARPLRGCAERISLFSSSRTRSAETMSMRSAIAFIAATTSGATSKSSCAAKRAARIIRSGSSEKDSSGRARGAQHTLREVLKTAVRVDELLLGQRDGHRVHGEVTAYEVFLDGVAVGHLGLARGPVVRLGAVRRDLDLEARSTSPTRASFWQPTVPKAIPTSHTASAHGRTIFSTSSGRASVVKSRSLPSRPSRASLTEPPTRARENPASWKRRARSSATGDTRSSSLTARRCTWLSALGLSSLAFGTTEKGTCTGRPRPTRFPPGPRGPAPPLRTALPIMWSSPRHFATARIVTMRGRTSDDH